MKQYFASLEQKLNVDAKRNVIYGDTADVMLDFALARGPLRGIHDVVFLDIEGRSLISIEQNSTRGWVLCELVWSGDLVSCSSHGQWLIIEEDKSSSLVRLALNMQSLFCWPISKRVLNRRNQISQFFEMEPPPVEDYLKSFLMRQKLSFFIGHLRSSLSLKCLVAQHEKLQGVTIAPWYRSNILTCACLMAVRLCNVGYGIDLMTQCIFVIMFWFYKEAPKKRLSAWPSG